MKNVQLEINEVELRDLQFEDAPQMAGLEVLAMQAAEAVKRGTPIPTALAEPVHPARIQKWERDIEDSALGRSSLGIVGAFNGQSLVGAVWFGKARIREEGQIYGLQVDPNYWKKKVGTALFNTAADGLKAQGFDSFVKEVDIDCAQANGFYQKRGGQRDECSVRRAMEANLVTYRFHDLDLRR